MYRPQIDRTVEKIDNGIKMTVASEDEEVVEYLQAKDRPGSKNELVTHVVENIENGVVITITTEDEDMLERLHNRADRLENGFIRRHKGMGRSMMKGMNGMMNRQGDMHDCSYKQQ
ncbi:MAG: hypothetical protein N4A36_04430 [Candidatus Gracilibacteria bacterium]|nr:hypothetical protein [Candidatus Gracilibacteria bacterium]